MMHRPSYHHFVRDLRSAFFTQESPWGQKSPKLKGSCAKGKTYERTVHRKLCKVLPLDAVHYNRWIRFEDSSGRHFAQPDIFILTDKRVILLECKLTQTEEAEFQLCYLYKPLLELLFPSKEVVCVQVCKNLRYRPAHEIGRLRDAIDPSTIYTYHYLGDQINV